MDLGKNIGLAFGGAAHELGIAANDFVNTPVGMITMTLIIWHFMGGMIMHLVGSILVLVVGMSFILWHFRSQLEIIETFSSDKTNIFGNSRLLTRTRQAVSADWKTGYLIVGFCTILVAIITAFSY